MRETPMAIDKIDQLKVVSQIAAATDRQQFRPGEPNEGAKDAEDDERERGHVAVGMA
jgi:hypothetical protein